MDPDIFVRHWVERVEAVSLASFHLVADLTVLPRFVAGDSISWCERFFAAAANPHRPENRARLSTYAAPPGLPWATEQNRARHGAYAAGAVWLDLLRYEYAFGGRDLTVYESVNFALVHFLPKPRPADSQGWARAVQEAAHAILNLSGTAQLDLLTYDYAWVFQFPPQIGEGTVISTNPAVRPDTPRWTDRADVLIHHDAVWIMTYKKRPPMQGFSPDGSWFDADFRNKQAP